MCESRNMGLFVDHIDTKSVACFHQDIEVIPIRMYSNPSRVISWSWSSQPIDQGQVAGLWIFLMSPYAIASEIRRIKIGFGRIKNHAVDTGLRAVLIVLDVFFEPSIFIDREDISKARVVIEGISVYIEGSLFGCQNEDGSGICICFRSFGYRWFRLYRNQGSEHTYADATLDERHCVIVRSGSSRYNWTISSWMLHICSSLHANTGMSKRSGGSRRIEGEGEGSHRKSSMILVHLQVLASS